MQRTISVMVGKGSVNHNRRKFHAINTDPTRANLNRTYYSQSLRVVYHELFDAAVQRYNDKQTRNDRRIENYYEKIRSGKQEKLFHEVILQVGNHENMSAKSDDGQLSAQILEEYMQNFQERNPNLKVFSAHLHMDEATPHLHIDFVPFIAGSKRGLDTRVSLKQALAALGFRGGSKGETEWNQWVNAEKQVLAQVMARHGIGWEQRGTQEKHLSVLEYEKLMRTNEVIQLEEHVEALQGEAVVLSALTEEKKRKYDEAILVHSTFERNVEKYESSPEWQIPEPTPLLSAKTYKNKFVAPFVNKLKDVIKNLIGQYLKLHSQVADLERRLWKANQAVENMTDRMVKSQSEIRRLKKLERSYKTVQKTIGADALDKILNRTGARNAFEINPRNENR